MRKIALKRHVLDIPNERSSHTIPTPRGGGLAIVITWYIGITIIYLYKSLDKELYFALLTGIILAFISLIDDLISIKPFVRFLFQGITATIAFYFLGGFSPLSVLNVEFNFSIFLYPFIILGIIWFINLFNFLDGIDAYASVEAVFVVTALFIFTGNYINIVLVAAVLGFLIWNWPRAKIFMGDVGSTQLGFILSVLGIYFHNEHKISIILWLMLTSLFWFDATYTLIRRWQNKEKLSQAHKKHAYQRIVQAGFSHSKTVYFSMIINAIIFLLVALGFNFKIFILPLFLLNMLCLFGINRLIDRRKSFK
ncbi:MAG: glycosyltransferase family 4 protein [Bacteroidales bacterium]|nr:glycosyltransferase family 4 protein [Bacteroidales bacterium]